MYFKTMRVLNQAIYIALVIMITCILTTVNALSADWKLIGGSQIKEKDGFVFYDNDSIEFMTSGNIKVWTKLIKSSDIDKITKKSDVIDKSARKLLNNYYPPYAIVKGLSFNEMVNAISIEEAANYQDAKKEMIALSEIDCKKKMSRFLSITIYTKDAPYTSTYDESKKWEYIAPETNFDTLIKIVCPMRR